MVAQMNSDLDPDQDFEIDPDAKAVVDQHGEESLNKAAIRAELMADRLRATGDEVGAARWRGIAETVEMLLQAAGVERQRAH